VVTYASGESTTFAYDERGNLLSGRLVGRDVGTTSGARAVVRVRGLPPIALA
jgi:YD repeat-containing protein